MAVRLIATDMDGTLLDGQGSLDRDRFARVLEGLEARQVPFVVASGNNMSRLLAIFEGFEDKIIFVADNGGRLYHQGQTLFRHRFTQEEVEAVLDFYGEAAGQYCLMVANDTTIYMPEGADYPFDETLAIEPEQLETFLSKIVFAKELGVVVQKEVVYKMGMWVPEQRAAEVVEQFNQAFEGSLYAVTSGYGSIDILPVGLHKAAGLERLLEQLGIDPSDVMAFGDSDNDLEMLQYAGHSYAMENASDKVKHAAKHLAPSNRQGGVLEVIEDWLAGE